MAVASFKDFLEEEFPNTGAEIRRLVYQTIPQLTGAKVIFNKDGSFDIQAIDVLQTFIPRRFRDETNTKYETDDVIEINFSVRKEPTKSGNVWDVVLNLQSQGSEKWTGGYGAKGVKQQRSKPFVKGGQRELVQTLKGLWKNIKWY